MFKPHQVPLAEARAGDILIFKRNGFLACVLSWLIQRIKEPDWDRWGWHFGAVISPNIYADAQFPKVKLSKINDSKLEIRCYRVIENYPKQTDIDEFINDHIGKPYDFIVYLHIGLAKLLRPQIPIPRVINRLYNCWEIAFDMMDYTGCEIDPSDYDYPFITDFLRYVGELKSK